MATVASSVKALNAYLKHSKGVFLKHHVTKAAGNVRNARMLHVVMGNEALDLDSTVSSVLLANLYHHYYMDIDELSDGLVAVDVLPVLPVERRDFVLRQDAFSLLERVGVDLASLLFIDDVPPPTNSLKVCFISIYVSEKPTQSCLLTPRNTKECFARLPISWTTSSHVNGPQSPQYGLGPS